MALDESPSWTSKLYNILRPAPHRLMVEFSNSQSQLRHSPGEIWKKALCASVYRDLAGEPNSLSTIARDAGSLDSWSSSAGTVGSPISSASGTCTWRRFIRVENVGLSGLLLYEIRIGPGSSSALAPATSACVGLDDESTLRHSGLTLNGVFGDPDDPSDPGMPVDDLLDAVRAKVVWFPAYACTSFVMGQAANAIFRNRPALRPLPDRDGFSVLDSSSPSQGLAGSAKFASGPALDLLDPAYSPPHLNACAYPNPDTLELNEEDSDIYLEELTSSSSSWSSLLSPDDPHISLCVRSCSLTQLNSTSLDDLDSAEADPQQEPDDDEDQDEDGGPDTTSYSASSESTLDSIGPSTPPPTASRQDGNKDTHGPVFVSGGTICLSVYDDLTSFLDFGFDIDLEIGA